MDEKEIAAKLRRLEAENQKLKEANIGLAKKLGRLEEELRDSQGERKELKETLNRAKDIRPWQRPNFRNVKQMAKRAFLDVVKVAGGWQVKMGATLGRTFKTLREIWLILTREDWNLHDEFLPYPEQTIAAPEQTIAAPEQTIAAPEQTIVPLTTHHSPLPDDTPIGDRGMTLGALRAEWRRFPSGRQAIAEACAKIGLDLAQLTAAT